MKFFCFNWFGQRNPSRRLINHLKYFLCWFQIRQDIWFSTSPQILSIHMYIEIHSAYSQNRKSLCVFSVCAVSFRVFHEYAEKIHSKIHLIRCILIIHTDSFCVFSVYCTNRFIRRVLNICSDSFRVFRKCRRTYKFWVKLFSPQLFKGKYFKKYTEVDLLGLGLNLARNEQLLCSTFDTIIVSAYSDYTRNDFQIRISQQIQVNSCFAPSPRRPYVEYKRMVLEHTHGLFIT